MQKKNLILGLAIIVLVFALMVVSARDYELVCLGPGETIEWSLCNSGMEDYTCTHDLCPKCTYIGSKGFHCPATQNPNPCNRLGLNCVGPGQSAPDTLPPSITINSPVEGEIYGDKYLLFDINVSEECDIYYSEDGGDDWDRLCRSCLHVQDLERVGEGEIDLIIKAVDHAGWESFADVSFFHDYSDPDIKKTLPKRRSFFDGNFYVKFKEVNPEVLTLHYGNGSVNRTHDVNLETECVYDGKKYYECNTGVALDEFDGQQIDYWFVLEDIAGHVDESKHVYGNVDTTFPEINNLGDFWWQGEGRYWKYVYFNLSITEENLDEVYYTYIDSRGREKEKRLCSRLKDGICYKKKSFKEGHWDIVVNVIDEAGNKVGVPVSFDVVEED